ncbi:MAG: DsrE family protein [Magnetovibrio sp.]|nr:DsrE family protein [Magnetovibrio sp.]
MRFIVSALSILAVALWATATPFDAQAGERYGKQKVVYHINYPGGKDDKKYRGAMRNIQNHINAVGAENMDIKVVIHGNGIGMMKSANTKGKLQTAIANLKTQNVNFHVCNNTLKGRKIGYDQLYEVFDEDVVPSGVAELSRLQQMGYTYIKP